MVMKTYIKSILRSVKNNVARFISIMVVMVLGIAFVAGLGTLSPTIKDSFSDQMNADRFADITVKCKLATGFTDESTALLSDMTEVEQVETLTSLDIMDGEERTRLYVYDDFAMNINPLVIEGSLPQAMHEILVERGSNEADFYKIGDEITMNIYGMEISCKVVGIVSNPRIFDCFGEPYIDSETQSQDGYLKKIVYFDRAYCMLPLPKTDAYVRLAGLGDRAYFSDEYLEDVENAIERIKGVLGEENYEFLTVESVKSYAALDSYCDKISVITLIFPVFFIAVAALVVMTTVSRMVEEERSLLGCLKSLGMGDGKIVFKYLFLTGLCWLVSTVVGLTAGIQILPAAIYPAFETMFYMPPMSANLYFGDGIIAAALMLAAVMIVSYSVSRRSLKEKPAALLTAKAPKAGKKILLERIPFLWKPLSFRYKSSIRNIFRYKKNLIMTLVSVAGATALVFAGFAILNVADALAVGGGSFVGMKDSIAMIAVVVIIFALLLCVFVVYNLTNLNIGERKKEIATLGVLGYHDGETLGYIYRETLMMAIVGAMFGVALGVGLIEFLLVYLEFGSLADVKWHTYLLSILLVLLFVAITDFLLARKILRIDMTTSLKSND